MYYIVILNIMYQLHLIRTASLQVMFSVNQLHHYNQVIKEQLVLLLCYTVYWYYLSDPLSPNWRIEGITD